MPILQSPNHPPRTGHSSGRAPRRRPMPRRLALLLAGSLALLGAAAQAQTWTGLSPFGSQWGDAFNWSGVATPVSSAGTAITFAGNRRLSSVQNIASVFDLNALTFASSAGPFALSGNALRFAGSAASFTQNSSNTVVLANAVQISNQLTYAGNGSAVWKGGLANGAGGVPVLVKNGLGQLTLSEAGSFSGRVELNQGQLRLEHAQALQSAQLVLNTGATLDLGGLPTAQLRGLTGSGALALANTVLTLGGSTVETDVYGGKLSATTGGLVISGGSPGGTARLSGVSAIDTLRVRDGGLLLSGGSMTLGNASDGLTVGEGATAGVSARLDVTAGTLLRATGRTVQVDGGVDTRLWVKGTGSRLETGFQTLVGNHGTGLLQVDDGGTVAAGSFLAMGFDNASNGTLLVGPGGTVTSTVGLLGTLAGATGQATVSGAGALWSNSVMGLGGFSSAQRGGTGTLTLADSGLVTVGDTLTLWGGTSSVTVNGGQLRAGHLASDGAVGRVVLAADGALGPALVLNADSGTASFGGVISGAGSLQKRGLSFQTLAGANTFSGTTTIDDGQIVLGHALALQNSTVVLNVANGLNLASFADVTLGNLAGSAAFDIGSNTLRVGNNNQTARYSGVLQSAGGSLVKQGTGTSTLAGSGSGLGLLSVEGGILALDGGSLTLSTPAGAPGAAVLSVLAGQLQVLGGARLLANQDGANSVFVDGANSPQLLVDGSGSRLDLGYQLILGNGAQGGATVRNGGTLTALRGPGVGVGIFNGSQGTLRVEAGGTVTANGFGVGLLTGAVGDVLVTGTGASLTALGAMGLGGFTDAQNGGTGTLTVNDGASARAANTRLWTAGSRLVIDGGQFSTGALTSQGAVGHIELVADPLGGSALVIDGDSGSASFAGSIGGAGSLRKTGAGTQLLSGSNSFNGAVQVAAGTLQMPNSAASEYEVLSGAKLVLGARSLGTAAVQAKAGSIVQYTNTTLTGGLLMGQGQHDISAVRRLVGTTVSNGAVLAPASGTSFIGVSSAGQITNVNGRTLSWSGGANTSGTLTVLGSTDVSGFSSGGVIDVRVGGLLSNSGSDLVLSGGSRTNLGKAETHGGTIRLDGGTRLQLNGGLLVNNGTIDGTVLVNYGGLANGAGQYGTVVVGDGGRFSPGNSPGTVHSASATWGAGGSYLLELGAASGLAGSDWDLWVVDGGLDITAGTSANSRFTITLASLGADGSAGALAGFDAARPWHWQVVDTGSGVTGFALDRLSLDTRGFLSDTAGGRFSLQLSEGDLYLNYAPVPEPASGLLLLGGLALLGTLGATRRRQAGAG